MSLSLREEEIRFFDKLRMSGEETEVATRLAPLVMPGVL
jgi:hypothetical protein